MSERVGHARRSVSGEPAVVSWALRDAEDRGLVLLGAAGLPTDLRATSTLQAAVMPKGHAALVARGSGARGELCVLRSAAQGELTSARSAFGVREVATELLRPVTLPGASPFALGPALAHARTSYHPPRAGALTSEVDRFLLRWAVLEARAAHESEGLRGAQWVDVAPLPHQLAVVRRALDAPTVRWVLADEVGLGKTVEALMVWSALSAASPGMRCVIAAPRHLLFQWTLEVMRRTERRVRAQRSDDPPPVFDAQTGAAAFGVDNARGVVLAEHGALPALPALAEVVDMLVVDEAQTLNVEQRAAVERLAGPSKHLLLLTATPRETRRGAGAVQGFRQGFAWAAGLVDPKWPPTAKPDASEAERERAVDDAIAEAKRLDARLPSLDAAARGRERRALRDRTILERVLRSRRAGLPEGLVARRRLIRVPVDYAASELALLRAAQALEPEQRARVIPRACSSWDALAADAAARSPELVPLLREVRPPQQERVLDAKREALLDLCARLWDEDPSAKIVVRCEYSQTLEGVREALGAALRRGGLRRSAEAERTRWGEDEGVGPVARLDASQDAMLEALRSPSTAGASMLAHLWSFEDRAEGAAVALVSNDAGATGLNLQFASALILYDLPWTPSVLEQWIGRLDRIGQGADEVRVFAMSHPASPAAQLLDVYEGLGAFDARGPRVAPEVERAISALLKPAEDDDRTWEQSMSDLRRRRSMTEAEDVGASLDVEEVDVPPNDARPRADRELMTALGRAGLSVEARSGGEHRIAWPESDSDRVILPRVQSGLERGALKGANPEQAAMRAERRRSLRVTSEQLGRGLWLRRWGLDYFSPRHPLFGDLEEDLLRDPTLSLGHLRVGAGAAHVPPGEYLLALTRNFPHLGGAAIGWSAWSDEDCYRSDDVREDAAAGSLWLRLVEGLARMTGLRVAVQLRRRAFRLGVGAPEALEQELADRLLTAAAKGVRVSEFATIPEALAAELESSAISDEARAQVREAADRVVRDGLIEADRLIAARQRALLAVSEDGDAWRGLREARKRELETATSLREKVDALGRDPELGALEAARQRLVAAAVIEVTT